MRKSALAAQLVDSQRLLRRERARAEEAMAGLERLAGVLDALASAVVVCDARGRVVHRNAQAETLATSRGVEALTQQAVDELLGRALGGSRGERTVELHGPPPRTYEITAVPIADGAVAIVDDVSERRRMDVVRRDFVANVSHELRTPVGGLAVLAETLADEEDPLVARRLADRISVEAQRVGTMIDDLLDLSRIEAGLPPRDPVDVSSLLAQAVERNRPLADQRGVEIDLREAPSDTVVLGDRGQLLSAVGNLLDNAVKASEAGTSVELGARVTDGHVEVVVRDHGIGIPPRDLERVFERFYRVDRARSRQTGGTGLGLAIVRHVAVNHGGAVTVDSREGEGATFILRLPTADA